MHNEEDRALFGFSDFEKAELKFLKLLDLTIKISKEDIKLGYSADYSSPLWDKKLIQKVK
ncbi:Imm59 family immunity protein [Listeria innocua]|nr:Imm59 family immunity protein [Listeria innocua]UVD67389.1 Imm59 family immunity protein [Listeria innocua]